VSARLGGAAGAVLLTGCVASWAVGGDATRDVGRFLATYGVAFAAYLAALASAPRWPRRMLDLALALSVLWRLALVGLPPLLSDDVNRYVWEGRIQLHGGNPYAWSDRPTAEKWAALRDDVWAGLNHPDYTAVYPPLWQMAAALVVAGHDSVTAMKAFLVLCELGALVALGALLRRQGLPRERLLVWAWSPLALVEIAGSGHNEAFGMLFVVLALVALESGRPLASAIAAGLGFQAKFLPGLVAASWLRRYRPWHLAVAALVALALVVPYWSAHRTLLLSLGKYSEFWRFNETLFAALVWLLGTHAAAVRVACALIAALAMALAWRRADPASSGLAVTAATLLLGPNLLPWYALWLLPFLVLREARAALLFTGTVALAYLVYPIWLSGERWYLPWSVRALEYGPCAAVVALEALRRARSSARKPLTPSTDQSYG
jgi:hypothetical protein